MTPDALRNVLDVSCETRIHDQSHFSWQAQDLVKLSVTSATFREILRDSRCAKRCIFLCKMRRQDGTGKLSEGAGAR